MQHVAFEDAGTALKWSCESDRGLTGESAIVAAESGDREAEIDGLATNGYGAKNAFDGSVTNDVVGQASGTSVVFGFLLEMNGDDLVGPHCSDDPIPLNSQSLI